MSHETTDTLTRRRLLKSGAGTVAAGVAVSATTGTASAQEAPYGDHLSDATNFDGETADATGQDEVTIGVGTVDGFRFSPPAIVIDPGTTVYWNWTGEGGAHNVYHDLQSDLVDEQIFNSGDPALEEGVNYEFTFEEDHTGVHPYVCQPHRAQGMKGVIVVGEGNVETETYSFGEADDDGRNLTAILGGSAVFGIVTLGGVAAYQDLVSDESY